MYTGQGKQASTEKWKTRRSLLSPCAAQRSATCAKHSAPAWSMLFIELMSLYRLGCQITSECASCCGDPFVLEKRPVITLLIVAVDEARARYGICTFFTL